MKGTTSHTWEPDIVNSVLRRLRPLLISVTVLILTAGIAFAAKPANPGKGHDVGQTVTTTSETSETETSETTETETSETSDTTTSTTNTSTSTTTAVTTTETSNTNCSVDPTTALPEVLAGLTHGQIVCWAAHQPTPPQYANHGAWVSHWAKGNHGGGHSAAGLAHHQ